MASVRVEFANAISNKTPHIVLDTRARKTLAQKFLEACGGSVDCQITREMLHKFAGMQTRFHNDRLFTLIKEQNRKNRNNAPKSENITYDDFMTFVKRYCSGNEDTKTELLFNLYDTDGNGRLDENELIQMLRASMEENKLELDNRMLSDLAMTLLEEGLGEAGAVQPNVADGSSLELKDFRKLFNGHKELITNLSTVIEKWLEPVPEKKKRRQHRPQRCKRICHWLQKNSTYAFWVAAFFSINLVLFVVRLLIFFRDDKMRVPKFWALATARGFGWCINFSSSFILLTMMRHFLTKLRPTMFANILPIDDHKEFHRIVGKWIVFASLSHMVAHLVNVKFAVDGQGVDKRWNYFTYLYNFDAAPSLGLIPGFAYLSGLILIFVLISMFVFTFSFVRRNGCFHLFYISHITGYPIFYILLVLHCHNFWKWFAGPAVIFAIEQVFRTYYNWIGYSTTVKMGVILPSKVTNLVLNRPPGFNFSPGDYLFINLPYLSSFEYHAFTISSAPENWDELSLHIRAVGPWTENLYKYFNHVKKMADFKVEFPNGRPATHDPRLPRSSVGQTDEDLSRTRNINVRGLRPENVHSVYDSNFIGAGHGRMLNTEPARTTTRSTLPRNFGLTTVGNYMHQLRQPDTVVFGDNASLVVPRQSRNSRRRPMLATAPGMLVNHNAGQLSTPLIQPDPAHLPTEYTRVYGKPLKAYIDGPYGAPSSEIFRAEHAVLIGAGIGVTPFASILQSIMYRHWATKTTCPQCSCSFSHGFLTQLNRLKKVDFFWTNPEQNAFTWFVSLLSKLEIEQEELGGAMDRFLDIHMYMTKALQRNDMKAVALQLVLDLFYERNQRDALTKLKARMNAGRPVWRKVFQKLKEQNHGAVSVFFCGPKTMGNEIDQLCTEFGFTFRTETF